MALNHLHWKRAIRHAFKNVTASNWNVNCKQNQRGSRYEILLCFYKSPWSDGISDRLYASGSCIFKKPKLTWTTSSFMACIKEMGHLPYSVRVATIAQKVQPSIKLTFERCISPYLWAFCNFHRKYILCLLRSTTFDNSTLDTQMWRILGRTDHYESLLMNATCVPTIFWHVVPMGRVAFDSRKDIAWDRTRIAAFWLVVYLL